MITCTQCGDEQPDSNTRCRFCGAPLLASGGTGQLAQPAKNNPSPPDSEKGFSATSLIDDATLPAWLKALRTQEALPSSQQPGATRIPPTPPTPAAPTPQPTVPKEGGFDITSLIDTETLPPWLKAMQHTDQSSSPSSPPQRTAPMPQPGLPASQKSPHDWPPAGEPIEGQFSPTSMIDDTALPPWLKALQSSGKAEGGNRQSPAQASSPPQPPLPPPSPAETEESGFSATSLIDESSLPAWLKALRPDAAKAGGSTPSQPLPSVPPVPPAQAPLPPKSSSIPATEPLVLNKQPEEHKPASGMFSAAGDNLPEWLQAMQPKRQTPPAPPPAAKPEPVAPPAPPAPPVLPVPPENQDESFSVTSLIDDSSLPAWLQALRPGNTGKTTGAEPTAPPASPPKSPPEALPVEQAADEGFSPASLLDDDSLPSWLKALQNTSSSVAQTPPAPKAPAEPLKTGPISSTPATLPSPDQLSAPETVKLPAISLSDDASLPPWLKAMQPNEKAPESMAPIKAAETKLDSSPVKPEPANDFVVSGLIDEDALPDWLKVINSQPTGQIAQTSPAEEPGPSPSLVDGFTAPAEEGSFTNSSIIDEASLPPWLKAMRAESKEQRQAATTQPAPIPVASEETPEVAEQPPLPHLPTPLLSENEEYGDNFSPTSLIDENALPQWLRNIQSTNTGIAPPKGSYEEEYPQFKGEGEELLSPGLGTTSDIEAEDSNTFQISSLLSAEDLPEWLRNAHPSEESGQPPAESATVAGAEGHLGNLLSGVLHIPDLPQPFGMSGTEKITAEPPHPVLPSPVLPTRDVSASPQEQTASIPASHPLEEFQPATLIDEESTSPESPMVIELTPPGGPHPVEVDPLQELRPPKATIPYRTDDLPPDVSPYKDDDSLVDENLPEWLQEREQGTPAAGETLPPVPEGNLPTPSMPLETPSLAAEMTESGPAGLHLVALQPNWNDQVPEPTGQEAIASTPPAELATSQQRTVVLQDEDTEGAADVFASILQTPTSTSLNLPLEPIKPSIRVPRSAISQQRANLLIAALLVLAILFALLQPASTANNFNIDWVTIGFNQPMEHFATAIDNLPSNPRPVVIVAYDWDASSAGEMEPMARLITQHLLLKHAMLVTVSSSPFGGQFAQEVTLQEARDLHLSLTSTDWVNIGYLPGEQFGLRRFANDIPTAVSEGSTGNKDLAFLLTRAHITTIGSSSLVIDLAQDQTSVYNWVTQVKTSYPQVKLAAATSNAAYPGITQYLTTSPPQLIGALDGLQGGAAYAIYLQGYSPTYQNQPVAKSNLPVESIRRVNALTVASVLIVVVVLLVNLFYYLTQLRKKEPNSGV